MNIYRWIRYWATRTPEKTAIRFAGDETSYARFAVDVDTTANVLLSLNVSSGARVAYLGYNHPVFLNILFACAKIGAILVPLNHRLAPAEHLFMLKNADAGVLFTDPRFSETSNLVACEQPQCQLISINDHDSDKTDVSLTQLMQLMQQAVTRTECALAAADSPLLIMFTSGTTGRPKGAVLTQNAVHWNALNSQVMHDMQRSDHILTALPFFHAGGLNIQTTPALQVGATVTLIEKFVPADFLTIVSQEKPTLTVLVPTQMKAIVENKHWHSTDLTSLRCVTTGSTMVQVTLLDHWHERGIPIVQVYGCTESGPIAIHQIRETAFASAGSVGRPALYCNVRVVDDSGNDVAEGQPGEFLVSGPNVLKEYWRQPEATGRCLKSGWFHTGDIGFRDRNGDYFVVDRKKRVIISGGENIYPSELERILLEHASIAEAVVVGHPHEKWGEVPAAAVVAAGSETPNPETLTALFEGRVGRLKHPQHIVVLDTMPTNAMGKIIYSDVQSAILRKLAC